MGSHYIFRWFCISILLSAVAAPWAAGASIQHVGDLTGGITFSQAWAVSGTGAGVVVVGESDATNGREAYRWTPGGGIVSLGDLPGGIVQSTARAVSANGTVVAGTGQSGGNEAFRFTTAGGTMTGLGGMRPTSFNSTANGISADGAVVVGVGNTLTHAQQAFRWTSGGGMMALDPPNATLYSIGHGVSADGTTVVGERANTGSTTGTEAFRWTAGTGIVGLGVPVAGSSTTKAFAVSADGSVVVGRIDTSQSEAFRWTQATGIQGLGDIPGAGFFSIAYGVSGDGTVVVGQGQNTSGFVASIWTAGGGMKSLRDVLATEHGVNMTGWQLDEARGISADGLTIVGNGFFNGQPVGWVATVPEPGSLGLAFAGAVGLFGLMGRQRRRCR